MRATDRLPNYDGQPVDAAVHTTYTTYTFPPSPCADYSRALQRRHFPHHLQPLLKPQTPSNPPSPPRPSPPHPPLPRHPPRASRTQVAIVGHAGAGVEAREARLVAVGVDWRYQHQQVDGGGGTRMGRRWETHAPDKAAPSASQTPAADTTPAGPRVHSAPPHGRGDAAKRGAGTARRRRRRKPARRRPSPPPPPARTPRRDRNARGEKRPSRASGPRAGRPDARRRG